MPKFTSNENMYNVPYSGTHMQAQTDRHMIKVRTNRQTDTDICRETLLTPHYIKASLVHSEP